MGYNDRQTKILQYLSSTGSPASIQDIAKSTDLGDSRGVAQTIRRMRDLIDRTDGGDYELSFEGIQVAKGL